MQATSHSPYLEEGAELCKLYSACNNQRVLYNAHVVECYFLNITLNTAYGSQRATCSMHKMQLRHIGFYPGEASQELKRPGKLINSMLSTSCFHYLTQTHCTPQVVVHTHGWDTAGDRMLSTHEARLHYAL